MFRSIVIQKEMKNGDCSIIRRATRVAAPRVHLPASPKDQLEGATREGSRGVDYPLARARRIIEVRRGESDAGDPHLPYPRCRRFCSRSHAGEAARDHSPARTKKECRRRSDAGKVTRVGADRLDPRRRFTLVEF